MMRQLSSNGVEWLSLSKAAKRLNVHPTTLRRWADEGQIPFMLTPGGHRRFAASDVAQLAARQQAHRRLGPVERLWAGQALEKTREEIASRQDSRWLQQYDEGARRQHREMGQELMSITLDFLTSEEEDDALIQKAREIGLRYGRNARQYGLSMSDALRASMFFRDTLLAAAVQLPKNVRIPPDSQMRLLNRINQVLNTVQLGMAEIFEPSPAG